MLGIIRVAADAPTTVAPVIGPTPTTIPHVVFETVQHGRPVLGPLVAAVALVTLGLFIMPMMNLWPRKIGAAICYVVAVAVLAYAFVPSVLGDVLIVVLAALIAVVLLRFGLPSFGGSDGEAPEPVPDPSPPPSTNPAGIEVRGSRGPVRGNKIKGYDTAIRADEDSEVDIEDNEIER